MTRQEAMVSSPQIVPNLFCRPENLKYARYKNEVSRSTSNIVGALLQERVIPPLVAQGYINAMHHMFEIAEEFDFKKDPPNRQRNVGLKRAPPDLGNTMRLIPKFGLDGMSYVGIPLEHRLNRHATQTPDNIYRVEYCDAPLIFCLEIERASGGKKWEYVSTVAARIDMQTKTLFIEQNQGPFPSESEPVDMNIAQNRKMFGHWSVPTMSAMITLAISLGLNRLAILNPTCAIQLHHKIGEKAGKTNGYQYFLDRYREFIFAAPPVDEGIYKVFDISAMTALRRNAHVD